MKILVTGSNGQVGSELRELAKAYPNIDFLFTDRATLDISDKIMSARVIKEFRPDYLINAAAYTAVDKAEEDSLDAIKINATAIEILSEICAQHNIWMMHISSDYVYHIHPDRPLLETDETKAQGVYAKTKLDGDQVLLNSKSEYCILRTSWVYSYYGNNFVKTMLRLGRERDELTIVADQIGSPTYAKDIAETLLKMIHQIDQSNERSQLIGVYNFSNGGITHWADFARKIFEIENIDCLVKETSTEAYGAAAPRPKWSVLDKKLINSSFGIEIKDWEDSLKDCLNRLKSDK